MSDTIRSQDTLVRSSSVNAKTAKPAAKAEPLPKFADDNFFRTPPTPGQIKDMHRAIAALDSLPPVPKGVLSKRQWLKDAGPVLKAAQQAERGLGNAAFFHKSVPQGGADAARQKYAAVEARIERVEEQAGLRKPTPPLDPNRERMQLSKANEKLLNHPVGSLLGVMLAVPALVVDGADAASRPSERARYPQAVKEYEARLAQYEKALKDFPLN